ncbi:hypothetical protein PYCCODRAFT_1414661 [Trametes coccinea BRFM310]|uniref:Fungal-type protein kinase domain-containing protein n=1 Tax=Trametes coccinea (strain BRFM310) TaxID=1353009 RepID=A0A1Y2IGJ1_TRAC3|nr:hypothetical protein PYCCODRAFT_1414661 [Trametes coccinea BRFM310]
MASKIVLLSLEHFMEQFVPAPVGEVEPLDLFLSTELNAIPQKVESHTYEQLIEAFNQTWLLPNDVAVSTPTKLDGDEDVASQQEIDAGLYSRHNAPHDCNRWSLIELSIECGIEPIQQDLFDDDSTMAEASSIMHEDVLRLIMCHAVLVFDNQHRTHHFTLLILGPEARIIRWDRSGLLATNMFDYTKNPEYLVRFLWRFSRMTPTQRGHDPTAERIIPGSADYELMHARAEHTMTAENGEVVGEHARVLFKKSLFSKALAQDRSQDPVVVEPAPLWRLRVPHSDGFREFLVGLPHTTAGSLTGRGTRTYVALDSADKSGPFVYLKDAWRVAHEGIEQEGTILAALNDDSGEGPVFGVPTLRCHGDVGDQVTLTQEVWKRLHPEAKPEACPLKTHRHYRLVVDEVCLPMRDFWSFSELVCLMGTCIKAHGQAYKRKGFLHGDISAGNVLILPKEEIVKGKVVRYRVGILADWEFAKNVEKPEDKDVPGQLNRAGTWQFASAMALDNPKKRILVEDDMESFFHLIFYFALRFLPHNCNDVGRYMEQYFNGHQKYLGALLGGQEKLASMKSGRLTTLRYTPLKFYVPRQHAPCGTVDTPPSSSKSPGEARRTVTNRHAARIPHPINKFFSAFLKRIHARYTLYYRTQDKARPAIKRNDIPEPVDPLIEANMVILRRMLDDFVGARKPKSSDIRAGAPSTHSGFSRMPPGPSTVQSPGVQDSSDVTNKEIAALAAELGDQQAMIRLIVKHLRGDGGWPAFVDRIPDQLPPYYKPGYDTALGTKRTADSAQLTADAPPSKRFRSAR